MAPLGKTLYKSDALILHFCRQRVEPIYDRYRTTVLSKEYDVCSRHGPSPESIAKKRYPCVDCIAIMLYQKLSICRQRFHPHRAGISKDSWNS